MKEFMIYDMQTDEELGTVKAWDVVEAEINFLKDHAEYGSLDIYALSI